MKKLTNLYKRHRLPSEIIHYAVWLYHRFNMSVSNITKRVKENGNGSNLVVYIPINSRRHSLVAAFTARESVGSKVRVTGCPTKSELTGFFLMTPSQA